MLGQIFLGIWQNAPVWIWPLFFVLLGIGFFASKDRKSSIIPYFLYPFFGLSAANSVGGLAHVPLNWFSFAAVYLAGMALAFYWQDKLILDKNGWKMQLRGEWFTMALVMIIFFSNFVNGVVAAVAPMVQTSLAFTVVFSAIIGLCSGSFTGRALRVVTLKAR